MDLVTLSKSYILSFQPDSDDGHTDSLSVEPQKAYKIAKMFGICYVLIFS